MDDHISREAAIAEFSTCGAVFTYGRKSCEAIISRLKLVPAADVRPVVKARWYWDAYKYDWCCSNCLYPADHHIDKDDVYKMPPFPFCPHCGAEMRQPNLDTTKGDNHD